ncbi:MAG TPA: phosphatase PAP2 family protein [Acidimicrobiales bacterium]|nr:phosphatase PAP2 family protein [Acidimicrobiales bacterium]
MADVVRAGNRLHSFRRPGATAATAAAGLVTSYAIAVRDPLPAWELDLTEWVNNAPDMVAQLLYPIMQFGTLGGPILVAAAVGFFRRDWWLSAATVLAGVIAWFGAKGVKNLVDRGRPGAYLSEINIREGEGTGLGYISGHSAVAACAAVMAMTAVPARWRPALAAVAGLVGLARIVHGVHLPADLVGGWSFGTLVALGTLAVLDRIEPTRRNQHTD